MQKEIYHSKTLRAQSIPGRMSGFLCILCIFVGILFSSCKKDFEKINKNPNGFTTASDGALFNDIISSLQSGWNEQLYVNISVLYKENQQFALPQVKWNNSTLGTEEIWSNYYTMLPNFRELEKRFALLDITSPEVKNMMAMEKILLAYKTFKVTDLFGDIPFSEAGYGFEDVNLLHPKFDTQESIYKSLLEELKWAADTANIHPGANTKEPFLTFGKFDNLFFGDLTKWQKFANSLRLRYAMRIVNREPALAEGIIKDIFENGKPVFGMDQSGHLVYNLNESVMLSPIRLGYRNESKGWSFNQSKDVRMGSVIWHLFSKNDNSDGSGIFDPRVYYFFETNAYNKWVFFPNTPSIATPDGGAPYDYQRDVYYDITGSPGDTCKYSPVNYYLARDMDYQPDILLTGAEMLFIEAEAYDAFRDGFQFSINFWMDVMNNSHLPTSGAAFSTNINVPTNLNAFSVESAIYSDFFAGDDQTKLQFIYSQCFIDMFRQPQEAFALARRTGMTPHEGAPGMVYRFPIPQSEISYNQASWNNSYGASGDNMNQKVWWMN